MFCRALALFLCCASILFSQELDIFEASAKAIRQRETMNSRDLNSAQRETRSMAQTAQILVGMEVGLQRLGGEDVPVGYRPIYRSATGDTTGSPIGAFGNATKREKLVAKPGFAVGGMWARAGYCNQRLALQFMKIRGGSLDPNDHYQSEWVGVDEDRDADQVYVGARGMPIVGLSSSSHGGNLGFVFAQVPLKASTPEPAKDAATPKPAPAAAVIAGKSNLELEAESRRPDDDTGSSSIVLITMISMVVIVGLGTACYFAFGGKKSEPPSLIRADGPDGRAEPPETLNSKADERPTAISRPELARRLAPYLPGEQRATDPERSAALTPVNGDTTPPFFIVRAMHQSQTNRMVRLYFAPTELIAIDAGSGAEIHQTAGIAAAVVSGGGLLGALIGGVVSNVVADGVKSSAEAKQCQLDRLALEQLRLLAGTKRNFRAVWSDISHVSLEPAPSGSFWRAKSSALGRLTFTCRSRGMLQYEIMSYQDLTLARDLFERAIGNALKISSDWDELGAAALGRL